MIKGVSHLGIVVEDLEEALAGLGRLFGPDRPEIKDSVERKIRFALLDLPGGIQLELLQDYSADGWLARETRRRGTSIHHFCLISDDLEADLEELKGRGVELTGQAPVPGLRGRRIIFTDPESTGGIPVELSEP